jgi:hypothetical protein
MANPYGDQEVSDNPFGDVPAEEDRSVGEAIGGGLEAAGTFASSIVAEPVSGLAGIAGSLLPGDAGQGARYVEATRDALTYQPRGEAGQEYLQNIGSSKPIQMLGKGISATEEFTGNVGRAIGEPVGAPGVGYALGTALPTAIMEALGFKGSSKLRGARKISGLPDDVIDDLRLKGIDIDDLSDSGIAKIQAEVTNKTKSEIERLKSFEAEQIPTTQSSISQRFGDYLSERRIERADTPEGRLLRLRKAEESAGFQDAVKRYQSVFGESADAGDAIKEALKARVTGLKADAKSAYEKLDQITKGQSLPLVGNKVLEVFDDPKIQGMAGRLDDATRGKINDVLIEYGLDTDPNRIADWVARREAKSGAIPVKTDITPLSVSNFEDMRQALSAMAPPEADAALKGVINRLKNGIELELDQLDSLVSNDAVDAAKRARAVWKDIKDAQNTDTLVGRLIGAKRKTPDEDIILTSKVADVVLSNTRDGSIESVTKLVNTLNDSPNGAKAIGDLQAATAAKMLERSISKQLAENGVKQWNPQGFIDEFDKLEKSGKLAVIFKNNPEGLDGLRRIRNLSESTKAPGEVARFSGTADDIANIVNSSDTFKRLMQFAGMAGGGIAGSVAADVATGAKAAKSTRASKAAVKKALNLSATDYDKMMQAKRLYPDLFAAMVAGSTTQNIKQQTENP